MKVIVLIARGGPDDERGARFEPFQLEVEPGWRVLDALLHARDRLDPTLAFRASCGHGLCGSDAMLINGRERLACKTLVQDVADKDGDVIVIEPLRTLPARRDLIVDQEPFFSQHRTVKPFLMAKDEPGERERTQTPEALAAYVDGTNCILCAACYSACPVVRGGKPWLGPAAVVQAFRFDEDSRDAGFEERLPALDRPGGVWPCENKSECTRVCPRGIQVTKHINSTKRKITVFRKFRNEDIHDK